MLSYALVFVTRVEEAAFKLRLLGEWSPGSKPAAVNTHHSIIWPPNPAVCYWGSGGILRMHGSKNKGEEGKKRNERPRLKMPQIKESSESDPFRSPLSSPPIILLAGLPVARH